MEEKRENNTVSLLWLDFLLIANALQTVSHNKLHTKVWAIYALPVAYVVFTVMTVIIIVFLIRKKMYKYLWLSAFMLAVSVMFAGEAIGCVKDITGGTETFSTAYYRIGGKRIRWFEEDNDDYHYFELDKKLAKEIKGHCTYDESETLSVDNGAMEVFSCTEVAEITYYPNSRTVTDIRFTPKNG